MHIYICLILHYLLVKKKYIKILIVLFFLRLKILISLYKISLKFKILSIVDFNKIKNKKTREKRMIRMSWFLFMCFIICPGRLTMSLPTTEINNLEFLSLSKMVQRLQEYAPLKAATKWDNVGLLVEPSGNFLVKKIIVTNDLTHPVLEEAIAKKVDLIISYHPPMVGMHTPFTNLKPLTRLTQNTWKQEALIKCIENRIAVYSPHTTWDSIDGGINDWILSAFSERN